MNLKFDPNAGSISGDLATVNWRDVLLWLLRRRQRFRVTGISMVPLLRPDEEVLVDLNAYRHASPRLGDIVVAEHPHRPGFRLIKRIVSIDGDHGYYFLEGDNRSESTDSRTFGSVSAAHIIGQVTSRFF
ncbi:MAG: nickel-type superoxide dismutase maturation protease [Elainellaceae cyanobacterium]